MQSDHDMPVPMPGVQFRTTRWSVVLRAGAEQLSPEEERQALEDLCRTYWYPLYSFVRRKGYDAESAQDLTQGFFEQLLERNTFAVADRERGRFRTFLLHALTNYLHTAREKTLSQKRGGGHEHFSLDATIADERFALEPATHDTPERAYDRGWVETLLAKVMDLLRSEATRAGEEPRFERLKVFLVENQTAGTFAEMAETYGTTEASLKGHVRRLRARFRELLRDEVAQTVASGSDVDDELRYLISSL